MMFDVISPVGVIITLVATTFFLVILPFCAFWAVAYFFANHKYTYGVLSLLFILLIMYGCLQVIVMKP